jgi:hypothetical protein
VCEGASSEAEVNPRARRSLLEWGAGPRARQKLLEGGVSPRARSNLLNGAFDRATLVGRGGHRGVGCALRVRLSKRCALFLFFAGFKQDSPGFLGDPQGYPPTRLPQMMRPTDRTFVPPGCQCLPWGRVSRPAGLAPEALQERGCSCRGFTAESGQWAWYVFQPASAIFQPASVTHARLALSVADASQEV